MTYISISDIYMYLCINDIYMYLSIIITCMYMWMHSICELPFSLSMYIDVHVTLFSQLFITSFRREKKSELQEKMEEEKREEESWREELKDITEFSRQSKEKHTHYLIVSTLHVQEL